MNDAGSSRWFLVVKPDQQRLFEILRERLDGSGIEVILERRTRERRRGSLGPAMDRRATERRRQRPVATVSVGLKADDASAAAAASAPPRAAAAGASPGAVTHRCPTCFEWVELEPPRFPHPPARVEMEVGHLKGNGRDQHYVEIAAFTISGRLILSQRVPARRSS